MKPFLVHSICCKFQRQNALLESPTGTGKTIYINEHLINRLSKETYVSVLVCFSARTSANMTQNQIDGQLDRRKRGVYGPPLGKRLIIFVDDLNMPQVYYMYFLS